jgi:hypothetical protein
MRNEQETQEDLSLDSDAAEEVVGGRSLPVNRHVKNTVPHHLTSPNIITVPPGGPAGWEPDPNDPDPDGLGGLTA